MLHIYTHIISCNLFHEIDKLFYIPHRVLWGLKVIKETEEGLEKKDVMALW